MNSRIRDDNYSVFAYNRVICTSGYVLILTTCVNKNNSQNNNVRMES